MACICFESHPRGRLKLLMPFVASPVPEARCTSKQSLHLAGKVTQSKVSSTTKEKQFVVGPDPEPVLHILINSPRFPGPISTLPSRFIISSRSPLRSSLPKFCVNSPLHRSSSVLPQKTYLLSGVTPDVQVNVQLVAYFPYTTAASFHILQIHHSILILTFLTAR